MFGIEKKMAAHLASDIQLKESAQRAFHAYIKSVYLMKNKTVFDAHKVRRVLAVLVFLANALGGWEKVEVTIFASCRLLIPLE